ncbi:ribokinase [candidate division KSB1 bacterium]|nr:ribokinase [candidate division KSB1 bacterium]
MKRPEIVVVGSSNTDMVIKVPRLPGPGETIIGGEFFMAAGGKGANQAVAAAKLQGDVTFVARVGKDIFGAQAIANFKEYGIETKYIIQDDSNPSGIALIFVDAKGENSIAVASGANSTLCEKDVMAATDKIYSAHILLLQLEIPIETVYSATKLAAKMGNKVVLNPAPAQKLDKSLLTLIDILTPNESEAQFLTGVTVQDEDSAKEAAGILRKMGVSDVIITMGAKGAFLMTDTQAKLIPTKSINAIDTTAAGDAFNGALAYALARNDSLEQAVFFANMVGALSATKRGAQPSMPTLEKVQEFSGTF